MFYKNVYLYNFIYTSIKTTVKLLLYFNKRNLVKVQHNLKLLYTEKNAS